MNLVELKSLARDVGVVNFESLFSETRLIRAIQQARGSEPCFLSDERMGCGNLACEWRADCLRLLAEWRR